MKLRNRVALITGVASGIGRATMELFLKEGAKVIANDVNPEGKKICEKLKGQGYKVHFVLQDVSRLDELPKMVELALEKFGQLDILVNNAGIERPKNVFEITVEDWRELVSINLESYFFLSQAAAKVMKKQQFGRIINVSSIQGFRGAHLSAHYNASKGGVVQLTRCFAVELAEHNIIVNSVAPGVIYTNMSHAAGFDETETDEFKEVYIKQGKIPFKRPGQPDEVASSILFLASDDCKYMTGQVLGVDGGLSVMW